MKTISNLLITVFAASLCASVYADVDVLCVEKAAAQLGHHMYGGVLNIGTTSPWGPKYNRAAILFNADHSHLSLTCSKANCVDSHYGNDMHVQSCVIEPDGSPSGHYEVQLRGGEFAAALQIPVDEPAPVSHIKIDASTSIAISPNYGSNTDFEAVT